MNDDNKNAVLLRILTSSGTAIFRICSLIMIS